MLVPKLDNPSLNVVGVGVGGVKPLIKPLVPISVASAKKLGPPAVDPIPPASTIAPVVSNGDTKLDGVSCPAVSPLNALDKPKLKPAEPIPANGLPV